MFLFIHSFSLVWNSPLTTHQSLQISRILIWRIENEVFFEIMLYYYDYQILWIWTSSWLLYLQCTLCHWGRAHIIFKIKAHHTNSCYRVKIRISWIKSHLMDLYCWVINFKMNRLILNAILRIIPKNSRLLEVVSCLFTVEYVAPISKMSQ